MLIGFFTGERCYRPCFSFYTGVILGWFALIITPLAMMLLSVIGVHPVISSTALMAVLVAAMRRRAGAADAGASYWWGAGTMSSVASLSVTMSTSLYRVPSRQLALGPNLWSGFAYAVIGGAVCLINMFLKRQSARKPVFMGKTIIIGGGIVGCRLVCNCNVVIIR